MGGFHSEREEVGKETRLAQVSRGLQLEGPRWTAGFAFANGGLCTNIHSRTLNKSFHLGAFQLPEL